MGLLTVAEVAKMLRINQMTIYRLVREKKMPSVKIGGSIRLREQDVRNILNGSSKETQNEGKNLNSVYVVLSKTNNTVIRVFNRLDRASGYAKYIKKDKETYVKWFKVYKYITKEGKPNPK